MLKCETCLFSAETHSSNVWTFTLLTAILFCGCNYRVGEAVSDILEVTTWLWRQFGLSGEISRIMDCFVLERTLMSSSSSLCHGN